MLKKQTRKRLSERNWLDILREDSNRSLTAKRLRDQANRAIGDVTLLARKMPSKELAEVFRYDNIRKFIEAVLQTETKVHERNFDSRTVQLAALLVNLGVEYCKSEYMQNVEQNPSLNKATVEKLNDAVEICDAIALKSHLNPLSHYKGGLIYLFNWNNIQTVLELTAPDKINGEDNIRLLRYMTDELGKIRKIRIIPNYSRKPPRINCSLVNEKNGREVTCLFYRRNMNDRNLFVIASEMTGKSKLIFEKNLIITKEVNDLLVYKQV
jgi:hypothetical protein